jgi:two-component system, OmpR family, sensor histidine kinase MtrB
VSILPVPAVRTFAVSVPPVARWNSAPVRLWRRSLQVRVVALTLVLSGALVAPLGVFLLGRIGSGLVADKRRAALAEVSSGLFDAQTRLSQADRTDPISTDTLLWEVTRDLGARGSPAGLYDVALLPTGAANAGYVVGPISASDIPTRLRDVVTGRSAEAEMFAKVHRAGPPVRALIIGGPLTTASGAEYELYYSFPLTSEQQTYGLVRTTLEFGGLAIVLVLALVAYVVTRQVVRPVRAAARVARRLAAGVFDQRMVVRGEDDVALLAASFNDMAASLQCHIVRLEELSRVQQRFTADVSHELRTPLTTVRMAADMLFASRAGFPPAVARSAELLHAELDRFEALLVDLLEISRYDAGVAAIEAEETDVAALVRMVAAAEEAHAERVGCSLDLADVHPGVVIAEIDSRRFRRALRNLVENAVEHSEGGPVEIALGANADVVAVRVRDHGLGLRPGDEERVFQRFWRADPARARRTGGTGLGLSIALEDVRAHGGVLEAWGRDGHGASFRLALPRRLGGAVTTIPLSLVPTSVRGPRVAASGARDTPVELATGGR